MTEEINQTEVQVETRQTELGMFTKKSNWWTARFEFAPNDKWSRANFFGHDKVPGLRYEINEGSWYVSDPRSLIIGLLLTKGWQLQLVFKNPEDTVFEISDRQTQQVKNNRLMHLNEREGEVTQAWREVVQWTTENRRYMLDTTKLERVRAYLSPVHLGDKHGTNLCNSVAYMDIFFHDRNVDIDMQTRILHVLYDLKFERYYSGDSHGTRNNGTEIVNWNRLLNNSGVFLVRNHSEIIDILYAGSSLSSGQCMKHLYTLGDASRQHDVERLMLPQSFGHVQFMDATEALRGIISRFSLRTPRAHAAVFPEKEQAE